MFNFVRRGLDDKQTQMRFTDHQLEVPYNLDDHGHWRQQMRVVRKLNQLAKAASSYQTPKK